jgi:hypothetical protein
MRDPVEHVLGDIFGIDDRRFAEFGRHDGTPTDAQEHIEIAQRGHERTFVVG